MKRFCIFYYRASEWLGKPIEWVVCKCQAKIKRGESFSASMDRHVPTVAKQTDAEINKEEVPSRTSLD
jgi:hypothetical protein